jgi:ABC-2 type transport system ATP-binding protein
MIHIQNLYKNFGNKQVLKNIQIQFDERKVYGIVGENGAGKTTLFRCIAGLESYEGLISSDRNPLKNYLGLLLTDPFFFTKITGKEYIKNIFGYCVMREKKNYQTLTKKTYSIYR